MSKDQCEGRFHDGQRCPYAAKHRHTVQPAEASDLPVTLKLCGVHLRVIHKREALGSVPEKLDEWLRS